MKPSKKIFLLTGLVSGIIIFWLLPGVNTASHVRYTRKYEDTDRRPELVNSVDTIKYPIPAGSQKREKNKVIYKTETIEEDVKFSDINAKMYSRATHYEEEVMLEVPLVLEDTVLDISLEVEDTLYAAVDTIASQQ